jgi:hypothetical protein
MTQRRLPECAPFIYLIPSYLWRSSHNESLASRDRDAAERPGRMLWVTRCRRIQRRSISVDA